MYAIIATGGKQYKAEKDAILKVEKLTAAQGEQVKLDVLMLSDDGAISTGKDVEKAYALAEVLGDGKGKKIAIFKYKSKKNVRKRQGHRQPYTALKILDIVKA